MASSASQSLSRNTRCARRRLEKFLRTTTPPTGECDKSCRLLLGHQIAEAIGRFLLRFIRLLGQLLQFVIQIHRTLRFRCTCTGRVTLR